MFLRQQVSEVLVAELFVPELFVAHALMRAASRLVSTLLEYAL